jgi:hypothetical protein
MIVSSQSKGERVSHPPADRESVRVYLHRLLSPTTNGAVCHSLARLVSTKPSAKTFANPVQQTDCGFFATKVVSIKPSVNKTCLL